VRLRTLSEAECYARCYGGRGEERVSFVQTVRTAEARAEREARLRDFDERERALPEPGREAA
jgi:hypothetical protein